MFVETLLQSTAEVEPHRASEFWHDSIAALNGIDIQWRKQAQVFTASRFIAKVTHSVLLLTKSDQVSAARLPPHIRRDDFEVVSFAMFLRGSGYYQQGNRGARMAPGDLSIVDSNRPFQVSGYEAYEEIRVRVSRSVFRAHVDEPEAFAGRMIRSGPHSIILANYLQTYACLAGQMSDAEARVAIEGVLHLLRSFATAEAPTAEAMKLQRPLPDGTMREVARGERRDELHDA